MKCYYHKEDLDGICSAALIYNEHKDVELIGVDYLDKIDIPEGEKVFVVDFSFPDDVMLEMDSKNELIWIDHHETAIKKFKGYKFKGIQSIGIGACALVAEYLILPDIYPVTLLAEYDVCNLTDNNCLPFQYGMRFNNIDPESHLWGSLFESDTGMSDIVKTIIEYGKGIVEYERIKNKRLLKSATEVSVLDDIYRYKCLSLNVIGADYLTFESCEDYDIYHTFSYDIKRGLIKNTLYSELIDVSKIAVSFGGGGHKNAAGFYTNKYPFKLYKEGEI